MRSLVQSIIFLASMNLAALLFSPLLAASPLVITQQPTNQTVASSGDMVTFAVQAAGGVAPLKYQWYKDGSAIVFNSIFPDYQESVSGIDDGALYYCVITDGSQATVTSNSASVHNLSQCVAGQNCITQQPVFQTVSVGSRATFSVALTNATGNLQYQWYNATPGWPIYVPIAGANASSYTTPPTTLTDDASVFMVQVRDSQNSIVASSRNVPLHVRSSANALNPLTFKQPPADLTVQVGQLASFSGIVAGGSGGFTYQWYRNGAVAPGISWLATYSLLNVSAGDDGAALSLHALDSVTGQSLISSPAILHVIAATGSPDLYRFKAMPASIAGGESTVLTWDSNGAETTTAVDQGVGTVGSYKNYVMVSPSQTTTYTVTLSNSKGTVTAQTQVIVGGITLPTVATPSISPNGGSFNGSTTVTLTCATPGAQMYYTKDGSAPTQSSSLYNAPISLGASATLRVKAFAAGMAVSSEAAAVFTITPLANLTITAQPQDQTVQSGNSATFTVSAAGGVGGLTYQWSQNGAPLAGATNPSYTTPAMSQSDDGALFTVVVQDAIHTTVTSNAAMLHVTPLAATPPPTISPAGGSFTQPVSVTLSDTDGTAKIYYTTDGSVPVWFLATLYTGPFTLSANSTVRAVAVKSGTGTSGEATPAVFTFVIAPSVPVITSFAASPASISAGSSSQLSWAVSGATTLSINNGVGDVTGKSSISVTPQATLTYTLTATNSVGPATAVTQVTVNPPSIVATPGFSPAAGTYVGTVSVTLTCATSGAQIYYTTNGSVPTQSSTLYNGPFNVSATSTVNAKAFAPGMNPSAQAAATYTITAAATPTSTPVISPAGGSNSQPVQVTMSDADQGAGIYYTLDGSAPSLFSSRYTLALSVNTNVTVRAIALAPGKTLSAEAVPASYVFGPPQPLAILQQPKDVTVSAGQPASFSVVASGGSGSVRYQWYKNAVLISGATQSAYSIASTATGDDGSSFYVLVMDADPFDTIGSNRATLTVTPGATVPTISAFAASPASVTVGSSVQLSWTVTGATTLSINNGVGDVTGKSSISVTPQATLTYTLTATNSVGPATAVTQVTVNPPSIVATPGFSPAAGTYVGTVSVTLTCATSGAQIYYTTNGSVPTQSSTLYNGPFNVSATSTVNAKAFAPGMIPSAQASAAYTITPLTTVPTIVSFVASPASITIGSSSQLSWTVTGATTLSMDQGIGDVTGKTSISVNPQATTTYTLTASNSASSTTATTQLTVASAGGPTITDQPQDQTAQPGDNALFYAFATGYGPLTYHWLVNGSPAPSAGSFTNGFLILSYVQSANDGDQINFVVTDAHGASTASHMATLHVASSPQLPAPDLSALDGKMFTSADSVNLTYPVAAQFNWVFQPMGAATNNVSDAAWGAHAGPAITSHSAVTTLSFSTLALPDGGYRVWVQATNGAMQSKWVSAQIKLVDALPASAIRVYPNPWRPTSGVQAITFSGMAPGSKLKIFSVSGRLVASLEAPGSWDLSNSSGERVAGGIYLYLLSEPQGHPQRGKFAIIR